MPNYVQVKLGTGGTDGPAGWPVEASDPINLPTAPALEAGFDGVMTVAQMRDLRTSLQAVRDAWEASRLQRGRDDLKELLADKLDGDPVTQGLFRMCHQMHRRIQTLEGVATPDTRAQFRAKLIGLMD